MTAADWQPAPDLNGQPRFTIDFWCDCRAEATDIRGAGLEYDLALHLCDLHVKPQGITPNLVTTFKFPTKVIPDLKTAAQAVNVAVWKLDKALIKMRLTDYYIHHQGMRPERQQPEMANGGKKVVRRVTEFLLDGEFRPLEQHEQQNLGEAAHEWNEEVLQIYKITGDGELSVRYQGWDAMSALCAFYEWSEDLWTDDLTGTSAGIFLRDAHTEADGQQVANIVEEFKTDGHHTIKLKFTDGASLRVVLDSNQLGILAN